MSVASDDWAFSPPAEAVVESEFDDLKPLSDVSGAQPHIPLIYGSLP